MSNFAGVTFPYQKTTPSDDAIIRRAALTDGILGGCEFTFAGATLTMAAGQLLLCGRLIRHTAASGFVFDGASSGYARLVLTVDVTKTSTLDSFDMVEASVEYAASTAAFAELAQEDINNGGTRYQVAACTVALAAAGIDAIVSRLQPCAAGGSGLNFKLVGGLTQPADPEENMIWVETDVPITAWSFSNAAPTEAEEGFVWIVTGACSNGSFNALRSNGIELHPTEAKQLVGSSWVTLPAMTFRGNAWKDWGRYLYNGGNEFEPVTGGWDLFNPDESKCSAVKEPDKIALSFYGSMPANSETAVFACTREPVSLLGINTISLNGDWAEADAVPGFPMFGIYTQKPETEAAFRNDFLRQAAKTDASVNALDVTGYNGTYYVAVGYSIFANYVTQKYDVNIKCVGLE